MCALLLAPAGACAKGLTRFVNPLAGTATERGAAQPGGTFPGASLPFGMVQFGPDTTDAPENAYAQKAGLPTTGSGRGYGYGSNEITGFSLTHLSGAGCPSYGDFPMLPITRLPRSSPARPGSNALRIRYRARFSHSSEGAAPGVYRVRAHAPGGGKVVANLGATTRTAIARFTYPRRGTPTLLVNAAGSGAGTSDAHVRILPHRHEITGAATSGFFCAQRNRYRVYFAARFDRGFDRYGTWRRGRLTSHSRSSSDSVEPGPRNAAQAGAYVSFGKAGSGEVVMRVGVSFVSVRGAERNLRAESRGHGLDQIQQRARNDWNSQLAEVRVAGAPSREIKTLYTDLYQAELAPRTFSDVDGSYAGMDGQIHRAGGYTQYADFSGWDVYRTEIQLLALLHPARASDMVRSLLADAAQSGCLPKWPIANGQTMEMVGDPADQIIASAAAFGARDFDPGEALGAMLKGATTQCTSPNNASYLERQGLSAYEQHGYIPLELSQQGNRATSVFGSPKAVYGSAATTLEYAGADFAAAQFASRFARNRAAYHRLMPRSADWKNLLDRKSRYLEPRRRDGSFPPDYRPTADDGWAEGDSAQYSWQVPWNLPGVIKAIGGVVPARERLARFLSKLNATKSGNHSAHAYLGNEPSLATPWIFDWLGKPYETQRVVRRALRRWWSPAPGGYPGQNDLGESSAWFVMGALGFYPEIPGVGMLALDSPLFAHEHLRLPSGRVTVTAKGAAGGRAYVHDLRLDGRNYDRPWLSYCALRGGARLRFGLGRVPDRRWGAGKRARPPAFAANAPPPRRTCGP